MKILKTSVDDYTRILKGAGIEQTHSGILNGAKANKKGTLVAITCGNETREHFIPADIFSKLEGCLDGKYTADYVRFVDAGGYKVTLEVKMGDEVIFKYSNR